MGYGIFYNPIEQLVLEQFSAEPPFGGSDSIGSRSFRRRMWIRLAPSFSNPFTGVLNPPRGTPLDWSNFAGTVYFGQFPANMRPAIFRPVQLDHQAGIAWEHSAAARLRRLTRTPFAGDV